MSDQQPPPSASVRLVYALRAFRSLTAVHPKHHVENAKKGDPVQPNCHAQGLQPLTKLIVCGKCVVPRPLGPVRIIEAC